MTGRGMWLAVGLLLIVLAYACMLFYRDFMDPDEGRYSEIPREMVAAGNWAEMRMLGYRYYEKPPLAYWTVAPGLALFGAREWAARLPLALNILALLVLLYGLARRHWPGAGAGTALAVMLSMAGLFVGCSLVMTDGFLTFWFSLTCVALFRAFEGESSRRRQTGWLLLAAAAAALGVLTKGAVAALLPGLILLAWLAWEKRWRALLTPALLPAGLLFLAILVPCLGWIEKHNPGFLFEFTWNEHIARFTGSRQSQLHAEPFWFYLAILPALILPWTLFGVRAVRTIVRRRVTMDDTLTRFLLAWAAVVIVFFSAGAGKLISYILPALPPLGLLLGRWGLAEPPDGSRLDRRLWTLGATGLWLAAAGLAGVLAVGILGLAPKAVRPLPASSALLLLPLVLAAGAVAWRRAYRHFPGLLLLSAGLLSTCALVLSPLAGREVSELLEMNAAGVYKDLAGRLEPGDQVVVFGKYRPALAFYTRQIPYMCYGMNEIRPGLLKERERPAYLWTRDDIRRVASAGPGRVYGVIAAKDYRRKFLPLGLPFQPAGFPEDPDTVIVELLPGPAGNPTNSDPE